MGLRALLPYWARPQCMRAVSTCQKGCLSCVCSSSQPVFPSFGRHAALAAACKSKLPLILHDATLCRLLFPVPPAVDPAGGRAHFSWALLVPLRILVYSSSEQTGHTLNPKPSFTL